MVAGKKLEVTAVMAIYNGREFLADAIRSIGRQTHQVAEFVIIDDGSTDGSAQLARQILSEMPILNSRASVVTQENAGQGEARNRGVELARSDYVALIDQDDTWDPEHVELLLSEIQKSESLGWVYSDFTEIDDAGRVIRRNYLSYTGYVPPRKTVFSLIGKDMMMLPTASLIRKEAFEEVAGFDSQFRGFEDDDLFFRLFVAGWDFTFVGDSVSNYRIHQSNSSRGISFPTSRMKFYRKYRNFFQVGHPYHHQFFQKKLVGRIVAATLQDAWAASRASDSDLLRLSRSSLSEIYTDSGWNFTRRMHLFFMSNVSLMYIAWFISKLKSWVSPRVKNQTLEY